jgi:hypothetical protein
VGNIKSTAPKYRSLVATFLLHGISASKNGSKVGPGCAAYVDTVMHWFGAHAAPLAVTMSSLSAAMAPDGITIAWRTESEAGTYQWLIERGANEGGPFTQIAVVPAANTSDQPREYSYKDPVSPGAVYYYRIIEVDVNGQQTMFGPVHAQAQSIAAYALSEGRPNPFNTEMKIRYQLPVASNVTLTVYNITGQRVRTLQNGAQPAAYYTATWNGKDDNGNSLSNGIYFYKLKASAVSGPVSFEALKRATLIK